MNPAQECAAGTKNTARRRQGYGGLAYLPAEASAKAGALFDIVNMRERRSAWASSRRRTRARSVRSSDERSDIRDGCPPGHSRRCTLLHPGLPILAKRTHVTEVQQIERRR